MEYPKRFRKAVKGMVRDGRITSDEWTILYKIIDEEKLNKSDAMAYIHGELKKVSTPTNWPQKIKEWAGAIVAVTGGVIGIKKGYDTLLGKGQKKVDTKNFLPPSLH